MSATLVACSLAHARDLETAAFFHALTDLRRRVHFFPEALKIREPGESPMSVPHNMNLRGAANAVVSFRNRPFPMRAGKTTL